MRKSKVKVYRPKTLEEEKAFDQADELFGHLQLRPATPSLNWTTYS